MAAARITPGPGQESVWDYPRPPRLESSPDHVRVVCGGITIADSRRTWRVLETSHPPVYYIPARDLRMDLLRAESRTTVCEWKGRASYFTLDLPDRTTAAVAWSYQQPVPAFAPIAGALAFYPGKVDACFVNDEQVQPQPGDFYGGWITSRIVGPFKGAAGTWGW